MPRFICIGTGPGPKNVMFEDDEGHLVITTYREWKHKYSKGVSSLAEDGFFTVIGGMVQFDPIERETNDGTKLRIVTIKSFRDGDLVDVTLWDQFDDLEVSKGDQLSVDGKASVYRGEKGDRKQISAYTVVHMPAFKTPERETENKRPARKSRSKGRSNSKQSGTPF